MTSSFVTRTACRLCGSGDLALALPLQPTPIGDNYLTADCLNDPEEYFNLDLYACVACGHVQLRDVVSPDLLYPSFPYVTSVSIGLPEHFRKLAEAVMDRYQVPPKSLVVEIGSNEGPMLRAFQERGCRVLGVEPAAEIARAASTAGVPTLARYYTKELAREILSEHGAASVVAANNVLANIDDLTEVVQGINELLSSTGILVMETSYWGDVIKKGLIDTIYHEHLSYFSVSPLNGFFQRNGLEVIDVEWNSNKGGSIRLTAQRAGGSRPVGPSVAERIALERRDGIHRKETFETCRGHLDSLAGELHGLLEDFKRQDMAIAGYGASVGTTTMLYELELGPFVGCLLDDNPRKHGKFSPGFHIPCVPSHQLEEKKFNRVVIFAWRYFEQIQKKHVGFQKDIGHFVIPMPEVRIV